jgi:exopolysaccharide biosynthesis predicted pyruvyltransferase EpsI
MKETKNLTILSIDELEIDGVYFNNENNLVKVKKIDKENKELHLFNISEQYNHYKVKFDKHNLIKRVR